MKYGADPTIHNNLGMLPLHSAAAFGRGGRIMALLKVDQDQVYTTDLFGRSPLVLAILCGQLHSAKELFLIYMGLDKSQNPNGWKLLYFAAFRSGNPLDIGDIVQFCQYMFENGSLSFPNLSQRDEHGRIPGHIAVMNNRTAVIPYFFDFGTIRFKDTNENSALHMAILENRGAAAAILLEVDHALRNDNETAPKDLEALV